MLALHAGGEWLRESFPAAFSVADPHPFPQRREPVTLRIQRLADTLVVEAMNDKYLAHVFFCEHGIPSPDTWLPDELPDELPYPVLVKAREGFGSRHIYRADDRGDPVIQISPPLVARQAEFDRMVDVLGETLAEAWDELNKR